MNSVWRCEHLKNQFCRLKAQPVHYQEYVIIASASEAGGAAGKSIENILTGIDAK